MHQHAVVSIITKH